MGLVCEDKSHFALAVWSAHIRIIVGYGSTPYRRADKIIDMYRYKNKDITVKNGPDYKAILDKIFSKYIRYRDSKDGYFRCISCGQIKPFAKADCGHYINRKHMILRYNEMNCNAQCRSCNSFDEGNVQGYRRGLISKYSEQAVLLLESMKYQSRKISDIDYKLMIDYYRKEVKRLEKEKNIKKNVR